MHVILCACVADRTWYRPTRTPAMHREEEDIALSGKRTRGKRRQAARMLGGARVCMLGAGDERKVRCTSSVRCVRVMCEWWGGGGRHTPPPVPAHLLLLLPTGVTSPAIRRPAFLSPLGFAGPPAGRSISVSACAVRSCRLLSEAHPSSQIYIEKDNANNATVVIGGEFADGAAGC